MLFPRADDTPAVLSRDVFIVGKNPGADPSHVFVLLRLVDAEGSRCKLVTLNQIGSEGATLSLLELKRSLIHCSLSDAGNTPLRDAFHLSVPLPILDV